MQRWLGRYDEITYTLMRVVVGALFACHGAQKIFGVLGGQVVSGNALHVLGAWIELVGGLLVMLGLGAGFAAFVASGEMAVGYFMAHAPKGFWPIVNKGELAVLYCFVFLYIASRGSGRFGLDRLLWRARK